MDFKVSIVIVSWNTVDLLERCIESIFSTINGMLFEVIVFDNASTDSSVSMVRSRFPSVHLIDNKQNLGFGGANNQAFNISRGEYILLLNPDTVLHPHAISHLVSYLEQNLNVGVVGPKLINPDGSIQLSAHPKPTLFREFWRLFHLDRIIPKSQYPDNYFNTNSVRNVDVLKGACMLFRRTVIEQIGFFDDQFFMYSEEVDLCVRILEAGWHIRWIPQAEVTHLGGQSTNQVADTMFLELYRNKIRYFRKHNNLITTQTYKVLLLITAVSRILFFGAYIFASHRNQSTGRLLFRQYSFLIINLINM